MDRAIRMNSSKQACEIFKQPVANRLLRREVVNRMIHSFTLLNSCLKVNFSREKCVELLVSKRELPGKLKFSADFNEEAFVR